MYHKRYQVWVSCEGRTLPEYQTQVEGEDGRNIACFIPSESGKNFAIHWQDYVGTDYLSLSFTLDGRKLGHGSLCERGESGQRAGVYTSADTEQAFQFADLQLTDDDHLLNSISTQADLGTIQVTLMRVSGDYEVLPYTPSGFDPIGAVHERSKKAGAHSVSLGKGVRRDQPVQYLTRHHPVDPFEGYVAVFIFRYRPRALLQAQGIMPAPVYQEVAGPSHTNRNDKRRAKSPADVKPAKRLKVEPGAAKVDFGVIDISDDEEDSDELQKRRQVEQAKRKQDGGRLKKEARASGCRPLGNQGDIIDLTLDD